MYLIRSPAGLKLQWYHSTGMMVIDTDSSSNKLPTMGLCGKKTIYFFLTLHSKDIILVGLKPVA